MERQPIPIFKIRLWVIILSFLCFFFFVGLIKRVHAFASPPTATSFCSVGPITGSGTGLYYWRCYTNNELYSLVSAFCGIHGGCNSLVSTYVENRPLLSVDLLYAQTGDIGVGLCLGGGCANTGDFTPYIGYDSNNTMTTIKNIVTAGNGTLSVIYPVNDEEAVIVQSYAQVPASAAGCAHIVQWCGDCGGAVPTTCGGYPGDGSVLCDTTSQGNLMPNGQYCNGFGGATGCMCFSYGVASFTPPNTDQVASFVVDKNAQAFGQAMGRDMAMGGTPVAGDAGGNNSVSLLPSTTASVGVAGSLSAAGAIAGGVAQSNTGAGGANNNANSGAGVGGIVGVPGVVGGTSSLTSGQMAGAVAAGVNSTFTNVNPANGAYTGNGNVPNSYRGNVANDITSGFTANLSGAFNNFKSSMLSTAMFGTVGNFFTGAPNSGSWTAVNINGGATFGSVSWDPGTYFAPALGILKGCVILICTYIGIRIVTKGGA